MEKETWASFTFPLNAVDCKQRWHSRITICVGLFTTASFGVETLTFSIFSVFFLFLRGCRLMNSSFSASCSLPVEESHGNLANTLFRFFWSNCSVSKSNSINFKMCSVQTLKKTSRSLHCLDNYHFWFFPFSF